MPLSLSEASLPATLSLTSAISLTVGVAVLVALFLLLWQQRQSKRQALHSQQLTADLSSQQQLAQQLQEQLQQAQHQNEQLREALQTSQQELAASNARFSSEQKASAEKLALLTQAREELKNQFENTAQKIFDSKSKQFGERSQEQIGQLLNPLAQQLKGFQETVSQKFENEGKERASLQGEIKQLMELNQQINEDAKALTTALTGQNKAQGNWGEMVLKKVLESSGLREGEAYKEQVSVKTEDGKLLQPDVVLYLPDERVVVIDSKVSLTAYTDYCATADEAQRQQLLKAHIQSIKNHVDGLSSKEYHSAFGNQSLDYVFMFLPVEAAYIDAIQAEPGLMEYAMKKNIGIISPSSLLTNLRTVANLWRYEHQNKNAQKIADTAGRLYDKLADGLDAFKDVENRLQQANKSWDTAWNRLAEGKGNVLRTANQIKELGVKTKKQIQDKSESGNNKLAAPEDPSKG